MSIKALVIDDDIPIQEAVSDILDSLEHAYDFADSVETARERFQNGEYDYVLLDLQIPVRARRNFPRIQNGQNLLTEIVTRRGNARTPFVIVMTSHGLDGPDLAVEIMKNGAADYVTKPFKTSGRTLDSSIRAALAEISNPATASPIQTDGSTAANDRPLEATKPVPFPGGAIVFHTDRVELCGVSICSGPRSLQQRAVLKLLGQQKRDKSFTAFSGRKIAQHLQLSTAQNGAAGLIRDLRDNIEKALGGIGISVGRNDVIQTRKQGYRFSELITVQDGELEDHGHGQPTDVRNVPNNVRDPNVRDVPNVRDQDVPDGNGKKRQTWIVNQLVRGNRVDASNVMKCFGCSRKTALRDFRVLKEEDKIEFVGARRNGCYRVRQSRKITN